MARAEAKHIVDWKTRQGSPPMGISLIMEISRLQSEWRSLAESTQTYSILVPIRLVTIIEVFVRNSITEIIDSGLPYRQRAEELVRGAKLELLLASHLDNKRLTLGDIISHTVPINSIEHIIAIFEKLIPGYKKLMPLSHERWSEDLAKFPLPPIIKDYDNMVARMSGLFTVRHILTHELPREVPCGQSDIEAFFSASMDFISATEWVIVGELKGTVPGSQAEMTRTAGETLREQVGHIEVLIEGIIERGILDADRIRDNQATWEAYANDQADLRASLVRGGSMEPMIFASAKTDEAGHRIRCLEWWLNREESDL